MTTEEALLIKEAHNKGFGSAATIKPAHILHGDKCPVIEIPEGTQMYVNETGNLIFKQGTFQDSFKEVGRNFKWVGIIYYKKENRWAEIVTHRVGNTEWKSKTIGLSEFPTDGVCWQPTRELRDYLLARDKSCATSCSFHVKGIAWNSNSCWEVATYSGKPEYNIKQLEPFFMKKYYDKHATEIKPGDHFIVENPGTVVHGIEGIVEKIIEEKGKTTRVELRRPLPRHPEGGELLAVPLDKVLLRQFPMTPKEAYVPFSVRNDYRLPDKWYIQNNPLNHEIVDAFMNEHSKAWGSYTKLWTTEGSHGYFHYPPCSHVCHSEDKPQPGYTLITTQQFKKHVLTHTKETNDEPFSFTVFNPNTNNLNLQEDEHRNATTIKVQRSNLTVRESNPIRGIGIKCPKVKIEVRSGHLPN